MTFYAQFGRRNTEPLPSDRAALNRAIDACAKPETCRICGHKDAPGDSVTVHHYGDKGHQSYCQNKDACAARRDAIDDKLLDAMAVMGEDR